MLSLPFLDLPPLRGASGTVRLPGSKSISNRVLLLAGLCDGATEVRDVLASDDTAVMLEALRALGCTVKSEGTSCHIGGLGGRLRVHEASLFLGNAGTAMRPLCAALAVLATRQGGNFHLHGVPRMHERPIGDLVEALRPLGCDIAELGKPGYPPLRIRGQAGGALAVHEPIRVRGDVSSQFLTALLLALPLAAEVSDVSIVVEGELISKPYVDITVALLQRFGISVQREGYARFTVRRGSRYTSPGVIHVEGDASSASYFVAMGALAARGGAAVRIEGVGQDSIQGDIRFVDAAQAMGAQVTSGPNWMEVRRGEWPLKPIDVDCQAIPDAAMTLAVMALYASGPSRLRGIASWRVKETDRIAAMRAELTRLGAQVIEGPDTLEVHPPRHWTSARVHTYDDHRMAMCLSLAAFNPLAPQPGQAVVRIEDPGCVAKTFPDYFEAFFELVEAAPADVPVITVDGPSASGKGTLASLMAAHLGYHLLDSGALYRAAALAASDDGVALQDASAVARVALALDLRFEGERVILRGQDVSERLRSESTGAMASQISAHPQVRQALHALQLAFRRAPGLVADGRDMGTVVFPEAALKVFLVANAEMRAQRRLKQLISKGMTAKLADLRADLEARDERDKNRAAAPLKPAEDACLLDNSHMDIDACVDLVMSWWAQRRPPRLNEPVSTGSGS
jgi:3-phosphoshikimate 1-carboxyvinyltransferase